MREIERKIVPVAAKQRAQNRKAQPASSSLVSATPQQIIARLRAILSQIDRLPLLTGEVGGALLDCFELTERIREQYRERVREYLSEHPGSIGPWRVEKQYRRSLKVRNAADLYLELRSEYPTLTAEELLEVCTASITALEKTFCISVPTELCTVDTVKRLIRNKEG